MSDKSDYNLPRTKLHNLLPDTYDSDVNVSLFENLFNRFLTKPETRKTAGYVGSGTTDALISRQIAEPTIHRQNNQLQPVLYNKIGSIDHLASWTDILNELERLGVDIENLPQWGKATQFNWAPPVDIDKIVNYLDYFWVDDNNNIPEYITVKNRCQTLTDHAAVWQRLIDQHGDLFPITGINTSPNGSPQPYNRLLVDGDCTSVFEEGFEFFVKNSTNTDLNNTNLTTATSVYDGATNKTTITLTTLFSLPVADGDISLQEELATRLQAASDQCSTPQGPTAKQPVSTGLYQWINRNKWQHRTSVVNFATAKQAALPIIEYHDNLQLNEWTCTNHIWKYRQSANNTFADSNFVPELIELSALSYVVENTTLVVAASFGNQTATLSPGTILENELNEIIEVISSRYEQATPTSPFNTIVEVTTATLDGLSNTSGEISPLLTSTGDTWEGYHKHWLYVGRATSVATPHPQPNPFINTIVTGTLVDNVNNYTFEGSPYATTFTLTAPGNRFRLFLNPLGSFDTAQGTTALLGSDDVRVYVNGVRTIGTYTELNATELNGGNANETRYVAGIVFDDNLETGDVVVVATGPAAQMDIGYEHVVVRTEENDIAFAASETAGTTEVSLITCRKVEQIKDSINQYPTFDVYNSDGTPTNIANSILEYTTDSESRVNANVQRRIVSNPTLTEFSVNQLLLGNNNEILAYYDYDNSTAQYWVDVEAQIVKAWTGFNWDINIQQGLRYGPPVISTTEPTIDNFQGRVWLDTTTNELKEYDAGTYNTINDVVYANNNPYLQTVWKRGLNNEQYVPRKVDWVGRTELEYNAARDEFISNFTPSDEALTAWYSSQINPLSLDGTWIGEWDIPAPLYYNNQHENRKTLTTTELNGHFNSIKAEQQPQPGIAGTVSSNFHTIASELVNYGVGGTIREYGSNFDTLLSSAFVNNVTPLTLFEFARDQYEILLNSLRENFRDELFSRMVSTDAEGIVSFSSLMTELILQQFAQNDNNSTIYGDTTMFIDNNGIDDIGLQNWIATLPIFNILPRVLPVYLTDDTRGINEIVHHDGHRRTYNLTDSTKDGIASRVVQTVDDRSTLEAPLNTMGRVSVTSPPLSVESFDAEFGEPIANRHGVYWYQRTANNRTLYRLTVASVGLNQPAATLPDGSLWIDTTPGAEVLRIKTGVVWPIVTQADNTPLIPGDGVLHNGTNPQDISTSTISAWTEFDFDLYLADLIHATELKLYEVSPTNFFPAFDFETLQQDPTTTARYNELQRKAFLDYVRQSEIPAALENVEYSASDPFTWNYRHSAPGKSYQIISSSSITNSITITGAPSTSFDDLPKTAYIKNSSANNGTITITAAQDVSGHTVLTVDESLEDSLAGLLYVGLLPTTSGENTGAESAGDWRSLYNQLYGTPYPNLEPWKLQGFTDKPTWWDLSYANVDGQRKWTDHMWEELRLGKVPSGELLPDGITTSTNVPGEVTQYEYFSVNTTNDQLLPPYYDHVAAGEPLTTVNRSFFSNIDEIISPAANYAFGERGPIETDWRLSSQFAYDQLDVAYQMQPLQIMSTLFGFDTNIVAGLEVDSRTNQTTAHNRTKFHGEILDDGSLVQSNGFNQWYVNYNRYQGFDSSLADFRRLWTEWTAPMTYQFATFVDTDSFQVGHRTVPLSEFDYQILSKKSPGVEDFWLNAFNVTILSVPPKLAHSNNQSDWKLELDISSPLTQSIDYYNVRNYQFAANPETDICELFSYEIVAIDLFNETLHIDTDQTEVFQTGRSIDIRDSSGNDGTYEVHSAVFDATTGVTIVSVSSILASPIADGRVIANYRKLPWETGDAIWFTSTGALPAPLISDQPTIGPIVYFVIKVSDTEFRVANTKQNALEGLPIDLISSGTGESYVGEIRSTFYALDRQHTSDYWRHYELDTTSTLTMVPAVTIQGMQTLVNIIDGYSQRMAELGFTINDRNNITDPDTGRVVDWQVEVERFIDFAFSLQDQRDVHIGNRFEVTVDATTNAWTFSTHIPQFRTGDPVHILSSNNILPTPVLNGVRYYIIVDGASQFRLAHTRREALNGDGFNVSSPSDDATLMVYAAQNVRNQFPVQEINPFRTAIFFNPPRGIVSNMISGPTEDIRNTQLLFDQFGDPLARNHTRIYRQDEQTFIQCEDEIVNRNLPRLLIQDPYNYIHFGGAHIFIDAYEHVMVFNNETTDGALLYDPFIGLNVTKFEMLFNRQIEFTERPNVGGSYFATHFNQGASLLDNFEASTENIRNLYDAYTSVESKPLTVESRRALGYEGTQAYLADLNLNQKSQFLFWRGLIQNKGAVESVEAFINSRRFIDARVDEFWAYKTAEFGSIEDREYPEMYINTDDITSNDFIFRFVDTGECIAGFGNGGYSAIGCGYDFIGTGDTTTDNTVISLSDVARWYNQPDILSTLENNGSALYYNLKVTNTADLDGITDVVFRHNFASDFETVTIDTTTPGTTNTYVASAGQTEVTLSEEYIPFTGHISVFKNGTEMKNPDDYMQTNAPGATSLLSNIIVFSAPLDSGDVIAVVYQTATLLPTVHFDRVNANIIRFRDASLIDPAFKATLWGYRVNDDAQNPARLLDKESDTVVSDVPLWDPARNINSKRAETIVTLRNDTDPAIYSQTIQNQTQTGTHNVPWNNTEVGTVWLDTSKLGYRPYYDDRVFQSLDDRLSIWGSLADWSEVTLYEWVESDVPPEEYNAQAREEEGNSEIPEYQRKSGRVRETLFELTEEPTTGNDLWIPLVDKAQEFSVLLDSTPVLDAPGSYEFVLDATVLGIDTTDVSITQYVSVYVNGSIRPSETGFGFEIPDTLTIELDELSTVDTVRFIKLKPHEDIIEANIDLGTMDRRFEHTVVPMINSTGQVQNKYYFWVGDKATRSSTQVMSPRDAEIQLTTIPTPYIVTGRPVPAEVRTASVIDLDKSWQYMISDDDGTSTGVFHQIGNQTEADYDTFTGGTSNILEGYSVGDVITMSNGANIEVTAVDLLQNVTSFVVLVGPTTPVSVGVLTQASVVSSEGDASPGLGFSVTLSNNTISDETHTIALGSPIKNGGVTSTIITNQTQDDYVGRFVGGSNDNDMSTSTAYVVGSIITMNNNATISIDAVDSDGDITEFTVLSAGDPIIANTEVREALVTPPATNSGFALFPASTNVILNIDTELVTVAINTRPLIPDVEYSIDSTGRSITVHQNVDVSVDNTVAVDFTTIVPSAIYNIPERHTDITIRGLRRFVTEDRRYTVRFTRDFTLRDNVDVSLQTKHEEWQLIRKDQPFKIPVVLWNRLTESMAGHQIENPSVAVPALDRVLYDIQFNTDTQYGLGDGQSFTNGSTAIQTLLTELFNEEVQLTNIDLDDFFATYNFDTPENIVEAMSVIYITFATTDVNRLFFAALHDAFTFKQKYAEIFKTSMIAVHGIRPFSVRGLFDD